MTALAVVLASMFLSQTPPPAAPPASGAADRAAAAAEKAAEAARVAAEAAEKAAEAAQKLAAGVPARPAETPPPAPPAPPSADKWNGTVGVGLISLTGNSRTVTFTTNAAAERKVAGWIYGLKLSGTYGESRKTDPTTGAQTNEVLAQAAAGQLRVDRRFHERYSGYVLGGLETDHVKSIELREYGELGATIIWVDAAGESGWKAYLRTDLGFRVTQDNRYQFYPTKTNQPDETLTSPRAGLAFRYNLTKDVLFTEDAEVMPNVVGASRVILNSLTKISARLSTSLAFGTSFAVVHDSAPALGKRPTDTTLALTLDATL